MGMPLSVPIAVEIMSAGLTGLNAPQPGRLRRLEGPRLGGIVRVASRPIDGSRRMPMFFIHIRYALRPPCRLCEPASSGSFIIAVPVRGRINRAARGRVGGDHGGQVDEDPGLRCTFGRIDQTVAAHPETVVRRWKTGNQIAARLVGDHDLRESRRQLARLGDDPYSGFGPVALATTPPISLGLIFSSADAASESVPSARLNAIAAKATGTAMPCFNRLMLHLISVVYGI